MDARSWRLSPRLGGYQTFHLLCISCLAVLPPLLQEARHWSHLTGTPVELFCLNYSSYMRAISFKGTDMSLPPHTHTHPSTVKLKAPWSSRGRTLAVGCGKAEIYIIGVDCDCLPGPGSIVRIYCKGSFSGAESPQRRRPLYCWTQMKQQLHVFPSVEVSFSGKLRVCAPSCRSYANLIL